MEGVDGERIRLFVIMGLSKGEGLAMTWEKGLVNFRQCDL